MILCIVCLQESMQEEGKLLAETPYGPMILHTLARVYNLQADIYLGGQFLILAGQEVMYCKRRTRKGSCNDMQADC